MRSQRLEYQQTVRGAGERFYRVLGMGHQTEDVAGLVADPSDVLERTVGVVALPVADNDLTAIPQFRQIGGGGMVTTGGVLDRDR